MTEMLTKSYWHKVSPAIFKEEMKRVHPIFWKEYVKSIRNKTITKTRDHLQKGQKTDTWRTNFGVYSKLVNSIARGKKGHSGPDFDEMINSKIGTKTFVNGQREANATKYDMYSHFVKMDEAQHVPANVTATKEKLEKLQAISKAHGTEKNWNLRTAEYVKRTIDFVSTERREEMAQEVQDMMGVGHEDED